MGTSYRRKAANRLLVPLAIQLARGAAACGEDDTDTAGASGNGVDRAFVAQMIPHHDSAVDMT